VQWFGATGIYFWKKSCEKCLNALPQENENLIFEQSK
jgi:hypothetical protein